MTWRWDEATEVALAALREDLQACDADCDHCGRAAPLVIAFRGDEPGFLVRLRSCPDKCEPLLEVLALGLSLAADRLLMATTGRAWSLDDPIAPVTDEGDLRQHVLSVITVDGAGPGAIACDSEIHPFEIGPAGLRFDPPIRDAGPAQGWIAAWLNALVDRARQTDPRPADAAEQALRCVALGHDLALSPDGGDVAFFEQMLALVEDRDAMARIERQARVKVPQRPS